MLGLFIISISAHSMMLDDVSVPAVTKSCSTYQSGEYNHQLHTLILVCTYMSGILDDGAWHTYQDKCLNVGDSKLLLLPCYSVFFLASRCQGHKNIKKIWIPTTFVSGFCMLPYHPSKQLIKFFMYSLHVTLDALQVHPCY